MFELSLFAATILISWRVLHQDLFEIPPFCILPEKGGQVMSGCRVMRNHESKWVTNSQGVASLYTKKGATLEVWTST